MHNTPNSKNTTNVLKIIKILKASVVNTHSENEPGKIKIIENMDINIPITLWSLSIIVCGGIKLE